MGMFSPHNYLKYCRTIMGSGVHTKVTNLAIMSLKYIDSIEYETKCV